MSAADKLAQVLAEHGDWRYGVGAFIQCDCGAHVGFPDDDGHYKGKRAHAAHVAAVVLAHLTAEGWAQGWWEYGVTYPTIGTHRGLSRESAEATAARGPQRVLVKRIVGRVTDWEPVDA